LHPSRHRHCLAEDLRAPARLRERRATLRWLGAGALTGLAGCGGGSASGDDATTDTASAASQGSSAASTAASCSVIPSETSGPYPGDGTNSGGNVLMQEGIVRSDIVASFGTSSGRAGGVPLTVQLTVVDAMDRCVPLPGHAVYLWQCDALGRYSMDAPAIAGENYLRGVQVSDDYGVVRFTTIFPGCYDGRWPHIHFEVFPSLALAVSGQNDVKTSQIALPAAAASAVYADARYPGSAANLARTSLSQDMVFSDGTQLETPAVSGSIAGGYAIALQVGIAS
jgi:protocatechuate 3,4-dioxygenase beta subunit